VFVPRLGLAFNPILEQPTANQVLPPDFGEWNPFVQQAAQHKYWAFALSRAEPQDPRYGTLVVNLARIKHAEALAVVEANLIRHDVLTLS
jgi:hypothetical protein